MAMNKAVSWSVQGVDFDAREAAQEAARRSGLSVGEWLNSVIAERAAERNVAASELDTEARLEAVTTRLQSLSREQQSPAYRRGDSTSDNAGERRRGDSPMRERPKRLADTEDAPEEAGRPARQAREIAFDKERGGDSLLDQAIAAFERRATAAQRQTADALADVNEWMEESRSQRERDREMLNSVAARLEKVEQRVVTPQDDDALTSIREAITGLEQRFEDLSRSSASASPTLETAVRDLDEKMSALAARMDRSEAAAATHPSRPVPERQPVIKLQTRAVGDAVAEIVRRRNHLDGVSHAPIMLAEGMSGFDQRLEVITKRLEEAADHASGRQNHDASAFESLQREVANLGLQLEGIRSEGEPSQSQAENERRLESLREEVAAMSRTLAEIAPRNSLETIETAIHELTRKLEASRVNGGQDALLAPIEQLASELREAFAAFDPRAIVARLEIEIRSIGRKVESFQSSGGIDRESFDLLCEQTREVRDLLSAAVSRPAPVEKMEEQIKAVTQRLDALPVAMPRDASFDLGPSLSQLRAVIAAAEAPAFKSLQDGLEALSEKLDEVTARPPQASDFSELSKRLDIMHEALAARLADAAPGNSSGGTGQLESMVRDLADKLEASLSRNDSDAQEALERQIALLSQRLDKSDRSLASIGSLDKSIGELFEQLEDTRRAAIAAAADAGRAAARDAVRDVAPEGSGLALPNELSRELSGLRSAQDAADQRVHTTLGAVHDTLEKLVDRLSSLEDDFAGVRPSPERNLLASGAPPVFAPPRRKDEEAHGEAGGLRLPSAELAPSETPSAAARVSDDADFLIEPGSGFKPSHPDREASLTAEKLKGGAPSQANFIAAARRAVAAAQAANADLQAQAPSRPLPVNESAEKRGVRGRLGAARAALQNRKRPLVLGIASLLLLLGAFEVLRMGGNAGPAPGNTNVQTQAETKSDTKASDAGSKIDSSLPTQTFAAAKPAKAPVTATPPQTQAAADATPGPTKAESATPSPGTPNNVPVAAQVDKAPVSTIPQTGTPSFANTGAQPKDSIAGLNSLAVTGDASAQYELGQRYAEGRVVPRDPKIAAQWFEKAATQGLAPAQYRLGAAYEKGIGVARDLTLSKMWYQRAAEAGNTRAMHNLAVLIAEGADGKPDYAGAANWFKQAAEYGVRDSQFNLAILYARGLGVGQNLVQSYLWFALAAKQGDEDAGKKSQDVAARLEAKDLATAKSLSESFRPKQAARLANEVAAPGTNWEAAKAPAGVDLKPVSPKVSRL